MIVAIDHQQVDHRAHEAGIEHVPEIGSQEEESDLFQDVLLLARLFPLLGERLNLRVLPRNERERDEREDLSGREDAPRHLWWECAPRRPAA